MVGIVFQAVRREPPGGSPELVRVWNRTACAVPLESWCDVPSRSGGDAASIHDLTEQCIKLFGRFHLGLDRERDERQSGDSVSLDADTTTNPVIFEAIEL